MTLDRVIRVRIILGMTVAVLAGAAAAQEPPVLAYGPKKFIRTQSKPQTLQDAFALDDLPDCDGKAVYVLSIVNGDAAGRNRISSGSVALNGAPIVRSSDLNQNVALLEWRVELALQNTLAVELAGGSSGAFLTISVRREIEEPLADAKTYVLTSRRQSFSDALQVGDTAGAFSIVVRNGTAAGDRRVDSASIRVNGAEAISAKDLSASVAITARPVVLAAGNTIALELRGDPGDSISVTFARVTDESACAVGPALTIDKPAAGATIATSRVLVAGTAGGAAEIGVTVNGIAADLDLAHAGTESDPFRWFVQVPLSDATTTLVVKASAPTTGTTTLRRTIAYAPGAEDLFIDTIPPSGAVPFATAFLLQPRTETPVERCDVDVDGDGVYDASTTTSPYRVVHTYETAGTYDVAVRCTMTDGRRIEADTRVVAQSFAAIDGLLRAVWTRFTDALAAGDVEAALGEVTPSARPKYRPPLTGIRALLPAYVLSIRGFDSVSIRGNTAHYLLRRDQNGSVRGFHVYFTRGRDGVWRLIQF